MLHWFMLNGVCGTGDIDFRFMSMGYGKMTCMQQNVQTSNEQVMAAKRLGNMWVISKDAEKSVDGRYKNMPQKKSANCGSSRLAKLTSGLIKVELQNN